MLAVAFGPLLPHAGVFGILKAHACLSGKLYFRTSHTRTSLPLLGVALGWQTGAPGDAHQWMVVCLGGEGDEIEVRDEEMSVWMFPPSGLYPILEAVGTALTRAQPRKLHLLELLSGPVYQLAPKDISVKANGD